MYDVFINAHVLCTLTETCENIHPEKRLETSWTSQPPAGMKRGGGVWPSLLQYYHEATTERSLQL